MDGINIWPVEPKVMIFGESEISVRTAGEISNRQPVLFACPNNKVQTGQNFEVVNNASLSSLTGTNGNFLVSLRADDTLRTYRVGSIMVFPEADDIILHTLKRPLASTSSIMVMITENCDTNTFEDVLNQSLLAAQRGNRVFIIADELQVSGPKGEELCQAAREAGVTIIKDAETSVQKKTDGFLVEISTMMFGKPDLMVIEADRVYSFGASEIRPDYDELLKSLRIKVGLSQDRYPFKTSREGIFVVFPNQPEAEAETQVAHLLSLAADFYADGAIEKTPSYMIDPNECALCLTCYRVCPHGAVKFGARSGNMYGQAMEIDSLACFGCGTCHAECPARAVKNSREPDMEKIMVLACENSGGMLLENSGMPYKLFPCAGAISINHMLEALRSGADKICVLTCRDGKCQHEYGGTRLSSRAKRLRDMLAALGIDKQVLVLRAAAQDKAADISEKVGERP